MTPTSRATEPVAAARSSSMILVPAALRERIQALTGVSPRSLEPIGPGHSNLVGAIRLDDRQVVVKAARRPMKRADVVRESVVLRLLDGVGVAPTHVASSVDDDWAVLVMERVPGVVALDRLAAAARAPLTQRLAGMLGAALRTVHESAPSPVSDADVARLGLSIERRVHETAAALRADGCGLPPELMGPVLSTLEDRAHARGLAFLHGDPGMHNALLVEGPGRAAGVISLVDWEHAGFGNPLHDVSWAVWTMRHRNFGDAAIEAFANAYGPGVLRAIGWDAATSRTLVGAQMACLLVRTAEGSPERAVWLDRIGALLAG